MVTTTLKEIITQSLHIGKTNTILFIASLVQAIIQAECIKPYRLARAIPGFRSEKLDAKVKRIRELIGGEKLQDFVAYSSYILKILGHDKVTLAMDRTNWQHGDTYINFLILSAVWDDGVSIPLYWIHIDNKGGNSDSETRIKLIEWFTDNFGEDKIKIILADREFPAEEFYDWLKLKGINSLFRSRENVKASDGNKRTLLSELYGQLKIGRQKIEKFIRRIYGHRMYVAVKRVNVRENGKKTTELVILVSPQEFSCDPFIQYRQRWSIEVMFNKFKGPGFNLEDTSVTDAKRLSGLLMLLSLAYFFSCYAGKIRRKIIAIKKKTGKNVKNRSERFVWNAYSLFRYGLDLIKHVLFVQKDMILHDKLWKLLNGGRLRIGSPLIPLIKSI